ncbi:MAG: hypothetical protein V1663_01915 [archaeon]
MSSISTKSQLWSIDFLLGMFIFILSIIFLYNYIINTPINSDSTIISESYIISSSLLSKGYPIDWTLNNVSKIGIVSDKRINSTKLEYLSEMDYSETKSKLNIFNDYYIFFLDKNNQLYLINNITGIGKPNVNSTNLKQVENPKNIVRVDRITIHNSTIIKMVIYTWG